MEKQTGLVRQNLGLAIFSNQKPPIFNPKTEEVSLTLVLKEELPGPDDFDSFVLKCSANFSENFYNDELAMFKFVSISKKVIQKGWSRKYYLAYIEKFIERCKWKNFTEAEFFAEDKTEKLMPESWYREQMRINRDLAYKITAYEVVNADGETATMYKFTDDKDPLPGLKVVKHMKHWSDTPDGREAMKRTLPEPISQKQKEEFDAAAELFKTKAELDKLNEKYKPLEAKLLEYEEKISVLIFENQRLSKLVPENAESTYLDLANKLEEKSSQYLELLEKYRKLEGKKSNPDFKRTDLQKLSNFKLAF